MADPTKYGGLGTGYASVTKPNPQTSKPFISPEQWQHFNKFGYVHLGQVIPSELMAKLDKRATALMMGDIRYDNLLMQLDPGGDYSTKVATQTVGFKKQTLKYRKIGDAGAGLECDPIFCEAMTLPVFREACAQIYGGHADISVYRAMLFNKPAHQGTNLPWHQDGGDWWGLDRDPLAFVWTAIDNATKENGCVQVIPGSHKLGLLSRRGHTLSDESLQKLNPVQNGIHIEVASGESVLMHNFLVHGSGVNPTDQPRRAFSVNYCDARTRVLDPKPTVQPENIVRPEERLKPGQQLPKIFDRLNSALF